MRTALVLATLSLITPVFPTAAAEEDQWYQVEVLVFQHRDPGSTESWPGNPGAPDITGAVELAPAILSPVQAELGRVLREDSRESALTGVPLLPFQVIDEAELQLGAVVNRLMLSGDYSPVLHTGWRQPVITRAEAEAVHVQGAMPETQRRGAAALNELLAAPPGEALFQEALAETDDEIPTNTVDGIITVSRNRYLHLNVDLLYRQAEGARSGTGMLSIFNPDDRQPEIFRMRQRRRIRAGELHHFDHPMFGLITLVTPYEVPPRNESGAGPEKDGEVR